jgi:hypothetical protein
MAKKTYGYTVNSRGKAKVVEHRVVKGQRGIDPEWDVHSFKEGPIRRLFNR